MPIDVSKIVGNIEGGGGVVDGKEYTLRVTSAKVKAAASKNLMIQLGTKGLGALSGLTVWHHLMLVNGTNSTREQQQKSAEFLARTTADYIKITGHPPTDGLLPSAVEDAGLASVKALVGSLFTAILVNGARPDGTPSVSIKRIVGPISAEDLDTGDLFEIFDAERGSEEEEIY
jgi:hypothetical protein